MSNKNVFLLGVFDMFHFGHLRLIQKAAQLGDLYIGIVNDEAVRNQKGNNRPIVDEFARKSIIEELRCVESCILLNDFKIPEFILNECDIIVVGADQAHIKNLDAIPEGKRYDMPRTDGVSTSDIIKKIKAE